MKKYIYLDDVRTPTDNNWIIVRNYDEFVDIVTGMGLNNIEVISLDHDLGPSSMKEYFDNVSPNYQLDYNNISEKTGYDCAKWLVSHFYDTNPEYLDMDRSIKHNQSIPFPKVIVHSANPIGSANITGYINNFLMNEAQPQTCIRVNIEHTI